MAAAELFCLRLTKYAQSNRGWARLIESVADEIRNGNPVGARQAVRRLMRNTLDYSLKAIRLMETTEGNQTEHASGALK